MAAAVTTVHGKEECLCSTLLLYLKIEGDATPAAHIHRVRPVESASMTVPGMHPCSCLAMVSSSTRSPGPADTVVYYPYSWRIPKMMPHA